MARSRAPQIDLDKIVIFDGLPVVPEDKLSKLKNFLSNAVEKVRRAAVATCVGGSAATTSRVPTSACPAVCCRLSPLFSS
jgi:hypothetical protein